MNAFVIMPFGNEVADNVYKYSTKPICEEFNLEVIRADEIFTTNPILADILSAIKDATVIIADISEKNANVFYELGISHLLKQKQTIMITQDDLNQIPFDVAQFRILKYENTIAGKTTYETQLRLTLKNILTDYKSIYKKEFDLIINVLRQTERDMELFLLIGLAEAPKPIPIDCDISANGHNNNFRMRCSGIGYESAKEAFAFYFIFDLAIIISDFILITEKGKAFAELVKEKGYFLDEMRTVP